MLAGQIPNILLRPDASDIQVMTCTPQLKVCNRFRAGGGDWEFTHRAADLQGPTGVGRGTSERRSGGIGAPKGREFISPSRDRMVDLEILVGGLEHFLVSHIFGIIIPID